MYLQYFIEYKTSEHLHSALVRMCTYIRIIVCQIILLLLYFMQRGLRDVNIITELLVEIR